MTWILETADFGMSSGCMSSSSFRPLQLVNICSSAVAVRIGAYLAQAYEVVVTQRCVGRGRSLQVPLWYGRPSWGQQGRAATSF